MGQCSVCNKMEEVRHIPLYVFGSEGIFLCHKCEMNLVEYVRKTSMDFMRKRKEEYLRKNKEI